MSGQNTDAALLRAVERGDDRAFAELFRRYRGRVFAAAYRRLEDAAEAEDILARVFWEAWRLRSRARMVEGSLLPWLLAITANVALNAARARRRYRLLLLKIPAQPRGTDTAVLVDERIDAEPCRERIIAAIAQLPPAEHAVLRLCLVEERSIAAAAWILGIPPGTVKSRLHRARTRLRAELADLRPAGPGNAAR